MKTSHNDISRRLFMEQFAYSTLGVSTLGSIAQAVESNPATKFGKAKHLVLIRLEGGMSHVDSFDPKDNTAMNGGLAPIATNIPGMRLSPYFSQLAKHGDKFTLLQGMTSKSGAHSQSSYTMKTSYTKSSLIVHPTLGPIRSFLKGRVHKTLPDTISINPSTDNPGRGYLGSQYTPLPIQNPLEGLRYSKLLVSDTSFNNRMAVLNALDSSFRKQFNSPDVSSYSTLYDETLKTLKSEDLKAFDLAQESKETREKYGMDNFGQGMLLARRLIDTGIPVVEITLGSWDFHNDIQDNMEKKTAILDKALAAFLEELHVSGKLSETVISVVSEFGRTPAYRENGAIVAYNKNNGRDHYPGAFSCLVAGCGLGGKVIGKTDDTAEHVVERPTTFGELNATLAHLLGIDAAKPWLTPSDSSAPGRPMTVGNGAKPISELL